MLCPTILLPAFFVKRLKPPPGVGDLTAVENIYDFMTDCEEFLCAPNPLKMLYSIISIRLFLSNDSSRHPVWVTA